MRMGRIFLGLLAAIVLLANSAQAMVFVSEILADPPAGVAGDANGDGLGSSSEDEFVEFYNSGLERVDLSGWALSDSLKVRHVFPEGLFLEAKEIYAVFGGGAPICPWGRCITATSGGLGLNNSGDSVIFRDAGGQIIDETTYGAEGGLDQSLVRWPEWERKDFVLQTTIPMAGEIRCSPGFFVQEEAVVIPEMKNIYLLVLGFGMFLLAKSVPPQTMTDRDS